MSDENYASDLADILPVEDNPGDVRFTEEAFKEGQICNRLYVATDGVAALDFLHQRGDHADAPRPDIVLLDLNLPRKNADEDHEEMNLLLEGEATITIGAREEVPMEPGDAIRISVDATRRIRNGDEPSLFVLVGAP